MAIETFEFRPETHPDAVLPLDSSAPSRKRSTPTVLESPTKRPCTIELLDDNSDEVAFTHPAATQTLDRQPAATQNLSTRNTSQTSRPVVHIPSYTPTPTEPRPSNLRPSLPRAAKSSSKVATHYLNNLGLSNEEDSSTIICEVPTTPDLNTLLALLAKENTEPQNKNDLRLNALLGLMAKATLVEVNPVEPFKPRNFKEAMTDYDHDK